MYDMKRGLSVLVISFCLWLSVIPLVWADEEEEPPTPAPPTTITPANPEEILAGISQFRELPVKKDVPIEYTPRVQLMAATSDERKLDQVRESLGGFDAYLQLLNLLPDDADLASMMTHMAAEQILGAYSLDEQKMMLVGDEGDLSALDEVTLAHEYTHALQDQSLDVGHKLRRLADDSDARFGLHILMEGDATFTSLAYIMATRDQASLQSIADQAN